MALLFPILVMANHGTCEQYVERRCPYKEESQNGSPFFVANKSERGVLISLGKIRNVSKCGQ